MKADSLGRVYIAEKIQKFIKNGELDTGPCKHIHEIKNVSVSSEGCGKCLEMGDSWVTLRLCLDCGHVGCCDNSKNKHATKHFNETGHPMMASFEVGEEWLWCYSHGLGFSPPKEE